MTSIKEQILEDLAVDDISILDTAQELTKLHHNTVDLTNCKIGKLPDHMQFYNIDFSNSIFNSTIFDQSSFVSCIFTGCKFESCVLLSTNFSYCNLSNVVFETSLLRSSSLYRVNISKSKFEYCNLRKNVLIDCNLKGTLIFQTPTRYNFFRGCDLDRLDYDKSLDLDTNIFYKSLDIPIALTVENHNLEIKKLKKRLVSDDSLSEDKIDEADEIEFRVSMWAEMPDWDDD